MKRIQKPKPQPRQPRPEPDPLVTKLDLLTVLGLHQPGRQEPAA